MPRKGDRIRQRFHPSSQFQAGRANRLTKRGEPLYRLWFALGLDAYVFKLALSEVLPGASDHRDGINDEVLINAIFRQLERMFAGPFWAVVEVGRKSGKLHVHVVAHMDDGPPEIGRNTLRCRWVYDIWGLAYYLHKPVPGGIEAELAYDSELVMSDRTSAPRARRQFLRPERLEVVDYGAYQCPYDLTRLSDLLPCGRCRSRCLCKFRDLPLPTVPTTTTTMPPLPRSGLALARALIERHNQKKEWLIKQRGRHSIWL